MMTRGYPYFRKPPYTVLQCVTMCYNVLQGLTEIESTVTLMAMTLYDIVGCIFDKHLCLNHPQMKTWQLHEQAHWWGAKSKSSRCPPFMKSNTSPTSHRHIYIYNIYIYTYIRIYIGIYIHIKATWYTVTFAHIAQLPIVPLKNLGWQWRPRLLIFLRGWPWMKAQAGDFWGSSYPVVPSASELGVFMFQN